VARYDGTCACDNDEINGVGYTYDYTRFSTKGCYKKIACPRAQISGQVCNRIEACTEPGKWIALPNIPYLEQQYRSLLYRDELPVTNESFVRAVAREFSMFTSIRTSALSMIARRVQSAIYSLDTCICVYPNNSLIGMLPLNTLAEERVVLPYRKAFKTPYDLYASSGILFDGNFFSDTTRLINDVDYLTMNGTLNITFASPVIVSMVRIHAKGDKASDITVKFPNGITCERTYVAASNVFTWKGADGFIPCSTSYIDLNFKRLDKVRLLLSYTGTSR
jgi:hypothetical protein